MKILKKNQAPLEYARQRKEQIDEGVILANKIDKLRETLLNLERQHDLFIENMKRGLNKEIDDLTAERDSLKLEIKDLKIELKDLTH